LPQISRINLNPMICVKCFIRHEFHESSRINLSTMICQTTFKSWRHPKVSLFNSQCTNAKRSFKIENTDVDNTKVKRTIKKTSKTGINQKGN
jgi:hypothetical protein